MGYAMKWLTVPVIAKGVDKEKRTITGMASTSTPDFEGEVILPGAWKESLRAWKKLGSRPKFVGYHRHSLESGHSPVLGVLDSMEIVETGPKFQARFAQTELGQEHLELYDMGAMDAFSAGFIPQEREYDAEKIAKLLEKHGIDPKGAAVRVVTTKAHLLEVSAVVVGMNMGALVTRSTEPAIAKALKRFEEWGAKIDEKGCAHGECPGGEACEKCAEKQLAQFDFNAIEGEPDVVRLEPEAKAEGGIVAAPLAIRGENDNECVVPLVQGQSVPVLLQGRSPDVEIVKAVRDLALAFDARMGALEKTVSEFKSALGALTVKGGGTAADGRTDPKPSETEYILRGFADVAGKINRAARRA